MLSRSFIHLPSIGAVTERELWSAGVNTWDDFLEADELPARVENRRDYLRTLIGRSRDRLAELDASYFAATLPNSEMWRLYPEFRDRAAFLDIETTGLSPEFADITLVGVLDASGYQAFVADENLDELRGAMEEYDLVVTFNGASFDLPFIEHKMGRMFSGLAHIDLMHPLRRLGERGGLKKIEQRLKVGRPSELSTLDGYDAVLLWRMWLNGDQGAKDTLIRYNAEDVASLPRLAEITYTRLTQKTVS
ncbi:MAG TPA: ribonuclease H-like domain-containing protein, partial [SAR202 cluster bacterium]|nr:ribonuclease H-like domain-containing protein [SAR202 cluster bacterium]